MRADAKNTQESICPLSLGFSSLNNLLDRVLRSQGKSAKLNLLGGDDSSNCRLGIVAVTNPSRIRETRGSTMAWPSVLSSHPTQIDLLPYRKHCSITPCDPYFIRYSLHLTPCGAIFNVCLFGHSGGVVSKDTNEGDFETSSPLCTTRDMEAYDERYPLTGHCSVLIRTMSCSIPQHRSAISPSNTSMLQWVGAIFVSTVSIWRGLGNDIVVFFQTYPKA